MSKISYSFRGCVAVSEIAGYLTLFSFAILVLLYLLQYQLFAHYFVDKLAMNANNGCD